MGYFLLVMALKIVQIISEVTYYYIYEQYNVVSFSDLLRVVLNKALPIIPYVELMYR